MKRFITLLVAVYAFGLGIAYADIDTPQFFIPVEAQVMVPEVTVTQNANGLNFGQLLPDLATTAYVIMDVSGVATTDNPADAQTAADGTISDAAADGSGGGDMPGVLLVGTTRTAGGFNLVSDVDASVTIVFADTLTLTSDVVPAFGAPETMTVSAIQASSNSSGLIGTPIALTGGTPQYFHIGGVLEVGAGQGGGTYTNVNGGLQVDIAFE